MNLRAGLISCRGGNVRPPCARRRFSGHHFLRIFNVLDAQTLVMNLVLPPLYLYFTKKDALGIRKTTYCAYFFPAFLSFGCMRAFMMPVCASVSQIHSRNGCTAPHRSTKAARRKHPAGLSDGCSGFPGTKAEGPNIWHTCQMANC